MNAKNIAKHLKWKLTDWINSIEDAKVQAIIKKSVIVTGGALVSLLNDETPNDYDVYFKTLADAKLVAEYYAAIWNKTHDNNQVVITADDNRIKCGIILSKLGNGRNGEIRVENMTQMATESDENGIDDASEPVMLPDLDAVSENEENMLEEHPDIKKPKYRPRYFSTNAISLSDGIQLVIRFVGSVEEIHVNYDFEHTKCSYDLADNVVTLPVKSLECIINRELVYSGSKYPLCSIIRTRKFISRGWTINAGQYVKMALQLNELNLKNLETFKDQLIGVDSLYFNAAIAAIEKKQKEDPTFNLDNAYLFEIINRIF